MKISFIATVFNEEENIEKLLDSIISQTRLPDEIIICDGGSIDSTFEKIENFELKSQSKYVKILILKKKGNRSIGRNEAIKRASGEIIVCSDSGCVLDENFIKNITRSFDDNRVEVVAGYYKGLSKTLFQKCLIPYIFIMPDKVNPEDFLPSTRSIAFRKEIWSKVGGFAQEYSNNEDFVFANRIKKIGAKIAFDPSAFVHYIPRRNLKDAFVMFYRFAQGDMESGIIRPKVILIFIRYFLGLYLLFYGIISSSISIIALLTSILIIYLIWSIVKNYKYIREYWAIIVLPVLQIVSDVAVLAGSTAGIIKLWVIRKKL